MWCCWKSDRNKEKGIKYESVSKISKTTKSSLNISSDRRFHRSRDIVYSVQFNFTIISVPRCPKNLRICFCRIDWGKINKLQNLVRKPSGKSLERRNKRIWNGRGLRRPERESRRQIYTRIIWALRLKLEWWRRRRWRRIFSRIVSYIFKSLMISILILGC